MKIYYCVATTIKDDGRATQNLVEERTCETKPENKCKTTSRADYYLDWFDTLEEAQLFVEQSKSK